MVEIDKNKGPDTSILTPPLRLASINFVRVGVNRKTWDSGGGQVARQPLLTRGARRCRALGCAGAASMA